MNPYLAELETLMDPGLPDEFTLWVPDAWMAGILRSNLQLAGGGIAPVTLTHFRWANSLGHELLIRADSDPERPEVH